MFAVASVAFSSFATAETVLWSESFDTAGASTRWSASAGTWQIGIPASGPVSANSGLRCAGTNLGGNYPSNANTRLERVASFVVPAASQYPRLRFWHWYNSYTEDPGRVQVRPLGGEWTDLTTESYSWNSLVWTRTSIDLSAYAGQEIQVAFHFVSDGSYEAAGWYVDDVAVVTGTPVFNNPEGFEGGLGDWSVDRGNWEVGVPSSGPRAGKCAGTVLGGNYPSLCDSRLISPSFVVPAVSQYPRLRFWHRFNSYTEDPGRVQVRLKGGAWIDLTTESYSWNSNVWSRTSIDLSAYAGQEIQVAFHFVSDGSYEDSGWYVDDVQVVTGKPVFNNPEGFEGGLGDWSVDRGNWEVGVPTSGPSAAHSGTNCLATVLGDNHPLGMDSRAISPPVLVPAASEHPRLRFWHWFHTYSGDKGIVEVKVSGSSEWMKLSPDYSGYSGAWTHAALDLSAYAGQSVQFAFHFQDDWVRDGWGTPLIAPGWYVDDVALVTGTPVFNNPEGFESGLGDWSADYGTWEAGIPTSGPPEVSGTRAHAGTNCLATVLGDNHPFGADSRTISPPVVVPAASEHPRLRFWHWFDTYGGDKGFVEVKPSGSSEWVKLSPDYSGYSGVWTHAALDLSLYAGQTVQLAFHFQDDGARDGWGNLLIASGWYIDDVALVSGAFVFNNPEGFESGLGDWSVDYGTWEAGIPTSGPPEVSGTRAHAGTNCLATVLGDNHPFGADSRTISPPVVVPAASEHPRLRFWHWFNTYGGDKGFVEVKASGSSEWVKLSPDYSGYSGVWTHAALDLSTYAGQTVQLAFHFQDDGARDGWGNLLIAPGWYVDDVALVSGAFVFNNPEGFESGLGDWSVDYGTWEAGVPTVWPPELPCSRAFAGTKCLATVVNDYHPFGADSRAISPAFLVPAASQHPRLRFWHWYSTYGGDKSFVEVKVSGASEWVKLSPDYSGDGGAWTHAGLDLSAYAGQSVQFAFHFKDDWARDGWGTALIAHGWYIDNVEITSDTLVAIPSVYGHPEGTPLNFTAQAAGSNLIFSLAPGAPTGASINPTTGAFTWTPSEQQGPGVYDFTVLVNQTGNSLSPLASSTFTVGVVETNANPVLDPIGPQAVDEGSPLAFTATATDPDNTNMANPTMLASATFDDLTFGTWTTYSVASNRNWDTEDFGGQYAYIFGFGANVASDDWLISPALKLDAATVNTLRFLSQREYAGPDLAVLVSTDYTGTGDPSTATWTALAPILPKADSSEEWTDSGVLDLAAFTGPKVYIAFRYTTTGTTTGNARLWRVDNIEVRGPAAVPPPQTLTYSLGAGAPVGVFINPTTGQFTWTPAEGQAPGVYPVTIIVTDNGVNPPNQSTSETIQITVREVNEPPTLAAITDKTVNEGTLLTFTAVGADTDIPANPLTYSLDAGSPTGAVIDPTTGVFTWIPTEVQGPSTYYLINPITVRVTDSSSDVNAPSLSATRTFKVTVNEVNLAPVLEAISNKEVNAGAALVFAVSATDADLPANKLTYSLDAGAPAGAAIDPTTGVFTWTPTVAGLFSVTVRVTDSSPDAVNAPDLSDAKTFTVQVTGSGHPPKLALIPAQTVDEGVLLNFTATATDEDLPPQTLTFSLDAAALQLGAAIDPITGVFSWTPTEAQGHGTYPVTVRVTDTTSLSATREFTVTVNEVNLPPVLATVGTKTVDEGSLLTFTASATDGDDPANPLTYSLDAGAPTGALIDPATGVFTWTPTEAQGSNTYSITVRVTDSSPDVKAPSLSDTETFTVTVNEVNVAPVLNPIPSQQTNSGATLTFTATASDADLPANTLTFSLGAGAPAGAVIDPTTGVFTWVAAINRDDTTPVVRVIVTDNGIPALSDYQDVSILVIGADDFTAWRRSKFGNDVDNPAKEATVWGDLADPDHDGTPNVLEFMTVREPKVADAQLGPKFRLAGGKAIMTYRETKLTDHDVYMFGTWSPDLKSWLFAGLEDVQVADEGDHYLMEMRMSVNKQRQLYMRLEALR